MAKQTFIRKLQRVSSDSYTLNIPKQLIQKFGWREKQKIELEAKGSQRLSAKDWKKSKK